MKESIPVDLRSRQDAVEQLAQWINEGNQAVFGLIRTLQTTCDQLIQENQRLSADPSRVPELEDEITALQEARQQDAACLVGLESRITTLSQELSDREQEAGDLRSTAQAQIQEIDALRKDAEQRTEEMTALSEQVSRQAEDLTERQAQLARSADEVTRLTGENEALNHEITQLKNHISQLESTLVTYEKRRLRHAFHRIFSK